MEEDCVICYDPLHKRRKCAKLKCKHIFHTKCIQQAFQCKPECPVCRKSIGAPVGKSPSGTMTTTITRARCSGFLEDSIVITYVIGRCRITIILAPAMPASTPLHTFQSKSFLSFNCTNILLLLCLVCSDS
mmetsp:Transcript_7934/g.13148  ORF Transcript_7934/g.13148 Transcript_7934/m.13148 type:complete len:131 (-) Transcript_7934:1006-1398(-)